MRELAQHYRDAVKKGKDPLVEKHAAEAENRARFFAEQAAQKAQRERERHTLLRVTREYHERVVEPRKSNKDSKAWLAAIETHIPKNILDKPIQDATARDLLESEGLRRPSHPGGSARTRQINMKTCQK